MEDWLEGRQMRLVFATLYCMYDGRLYNTHHGGFFCLA